MTCWWRLMIHHQKHWILDLHSRHHWIKMVCCHQSKSDYLGTKPPSCVPLFLFLWHCISNSSFHWIGSIAWHHWFWSIHCLLGQSHHHGFPSHHWNSIAAILYVGFSKKMVCCHRILDFGYGCVFSMNWHCSCSQSCTIWGQSNHLALPSSSQPPPPLQFYLYARPSKNHLNLFTSYKLGVHLFSPFSKYTSPPKILFFFNLILYILQNAISYHLMSILTHFVFSACVLAQSSLCTSEARLAKKVKYREGGLT